MAGKHVTLVIKQHGLSLSACILEDSVDVQGRDGASLVSPSG